MKCEAPYWVTTIFQWLEENMINQETINNAMNWLVEKGIIICDELIV